MNKIITSSKRLVIVHMTNDMAYDIWQNSLDEDNRRFVPDEVFETLEDAKEVIEQIISCYQSEDGPFIYAILRKNDNANIGYVQLVKIDEGWEIGYHIAKIYTGNNYATEALLAFLDYLKTSTDLKEVFGVALFTNVASRRVLQKCGFEVFFEGVGMYQGRKRKIIKSIKKL